MKSVRSPLVKTPSKAPTGITGFDEIAGSGLPRGRATLLRFMLLLSMWLGCAGADAVERPGAKSTAPSSGRLVITGSSTIGPLMREIGGRFRVLHPGVVIEVETGGSNRGIKDVTQGKADIGMASRALTKEESGLYSFAIGRDGVCLIVHKSNPVDKLTNRQVADIYTGKITNWNKVGGRDAPVAVMNPRRGYSSVEQFTHFFGIEYADIKAQMVLGDNLERVKAVGENPNGIAYLSIGTAQRQAQIGAPIKLLPVEGVAATQRNIRSGNFPISRPLLLLTKQPPTGILKEFINYSLSSSVTDLITQHDFVPYLD